MTILVGFSATRHSDAPINLAVQIALSSGDSVVAAAIVEGSWPPKDHAFDREFECARRCDPGHLGPDFSIPDDYARSIQFVAFGTAR